MCHVVLENKMKKCLMLLAVSVVLSSCAFITNKTEQTQIAQVPYQSKESTLSYDFSSDDSALFHLEDYSCGGTAGVKSCLSALPENAYFVKDNSDVDYTLKTFVSAKIVFGSGTKYLSILSLGIIPGEEAEYTYTFEPKLVNNKTGREISLSTAKIMFSKWWGWLVVPLGAIPIDGPMQMAVNKLMPNIYKEAAIMAYDPKSKLYTSGTCATTECRMNAIATARSISADDLKFVSENAKTLAEFEKAKAKLKGPYDICRVSLQLLVNKNRLIAKNNPKYWQLIDYYKDECEQVRVEGFSNDAEIGISKDQLLEKKGVPTKAYKPNNDTEMLTFSQLSGEKVITGTYTLDRGIVTSVNWEK